MGILKNREEFLPVTCAILKDAERTAFFSKIKKQRGGKPEELARLLGVPQTSMVDWINGDANIPYHTLQRIAHEFNETVPQVTELRRESLPVSMVATTPPPIPPPSSRPPRAKSTSTERVGRKVSRPGRERSRHPQQGAHGKKSARKSPVFSAALAYWTGATLAGAKIEGGLLVFSADRRIGQNFAAIWARQTKAVLGEMPRLSMRDNGKIQEAGLPVTNPDELAERLGFTETSADTEPGGLPRWVWSSTEWKTACLKGLVDASAQFHRSPSLMLTLSAPLMRAAEKIFASMDFQVHTDARGAVKLAGKEQIERYFNSVGTNNFKLRDQLQNYLHPRPGRRPQDAGAEPEGPEISPVAPSGEFPAEQKELPEPPSETDASAKTRRSRPRRSVFRGRPKR